MRRVFGIALVLGWGACAPPVGVRVGLVDGARLIHDSRTGKRIRAKVAAEGERLSRELEALKRRVAPLSARAKELASTRPARDRERQKAEGALREAALRLRKTHARYRAELNAYGERLLGAFTERVRLVAQQVRRERGLDLVLMTSRGRDQGLWVWPVVDITGEVRKRLDSEQGGAASRPTP